MRLKKKGVVTFHVVGRVGIDGFVAEDLLRQQNAVLQLVLQRRLDVALVGHPGRRPPQRIAHTHHEGHQKQILYQY